MHHKRALTYARFFTKLGSRNRSGSFGGFGFGCESGSSGILRCDMALTSLLSKMPPPKRGPFSHVALSRKAGGSVAPYPFGGIVFSDVVVVPREPVIVVCHGTHLLHTL